MTSDRIKASRRSKQLEENQVSKSSIRIVLGDGCDIEKYPRIDIVKSSHSIQVRERGICDVLELIPLEILSWNCLNIFPFILTSSDKLFNNERSFNSTSRVFGSVQACHLTGYVEWMDNH